MALLQLAASGVLLLFFLFLEILDWQGRMELIENRWPILWKAINNRPARLVLLVLCFTFLIRDFKDATAVAPAPSVVFPVPPAPDIGKDQSSQKDRDTISELQRQVMQLRAERAQAGQIAPAVDKELCGRLPAAIEEANALRDYLYREKNYEEGRSRYNDWNAAVGSVVAAMGQAAAATFKNLPTGPPSMPIGINVDVAGLWLHVGNKIQVLVQFLREQKC